MTDLSNFQHDWEKLVDKFHEHGIESLSYPEYVWLNVEMLIAAITNGGYVSYFYNPDGEYALDCVKALNEIGATHTRDNLQRIIDMFPDSDPPKDLEERYDIILSWGDDSENFQFMENADQEYFKNTYENVEQLLVKYILENNLSKPKEFS